MTWNGPTDDIDESKLKVTGAKEWAAGVTAVGVSMKRDLEQMGPVRTARTLLRLNQRDGFDCPGCAWPEPLGGRKIAEFCENGAKAVAEEATRRRVRPSFFEEHSIEELRGKTDYWLGQQGRITHPMVLREGATHYAPISWPEAFTLIADELNALASPDEAVFYTSGRTSNEAAYLYQLLVRSYGTNNLPDCSNMCHESSGTALTASLGIGKGSVTVDDVENADLIVIAGQNPGTNHPRMLSVLEAAKGKGAEIIAINPLPEAGLIRFKDPQKVGGVLGRGAVLADQFLQVRLGGDLALFQGVGRMLVEAEDAAPGTVLDRDFIDAHCAGFEEYAAHMRAVDLDAVQEGTGLTLEQIRGLADALMRSKRTVFCWAMGLTQHADAVNTINEAVNLLLLRGMIGKPGAGVCPVRGHSNVQGDRTMGIWEQMPAAFHDALDAEFTITTPRAHGYDTVHAIRAMRDGKASVFLGMGGNFASATPDTAVTEDGLRQCALTVQISTKLNRSHVVHGRQALILPTMGRTERDTQAGGDQQVSVEDSMSMVHLSRGRLEPASPYLRSEVSIVCRLAIALLGPDHPVPWAEFEGDYDTIRDSIARVVPGFADFNARVRQPDGFVLPNPPRDSREFHTDSGKANFSTSPLKWVATPPGRVILQTMRSHDQYNTTIYGLQDRYRGISGGRKVVFVNAQDITEMGLADGQLVDLVSEWEILRADGSVDHTEERRITEFRVVEYSTPRGNAAAYYPETNPLVPLDHVAARSNTPVSKAVVVRLEPSAPQPTASQPAASRPTASRPASSAPTEVG